MSAAPLFPLSGVRQPGAGSKSSMIIAIANYSQLDYDRSEKLIFTDTEKT
jgi:hypothetical protein